MKRKQVKINSPEELQKGDVINGILEVKDMTETLLIIKDGTEIPSSFYLSTVAQWLKDGATVTREIEETLWTGKVSELPVGMIGKVDNEDLYYLWDTESSRVRKSENLIYWETSHGSRAIINRQVTEYRPEPIEPVVVEFEAVIGDYTLNAHADKRNLNLKDPTLTTFPIDEIGFGRVKVRIEKVSK